MGADRLEKQRRGEAKKGKGRKNAGPPKAEPWIWFTMPMLESPAWQSMSGNALKIVMRLVIEHMAHGGQENGHLVTTYQQFAEYGLRLRSVGSAIREAECLGWIEVDRGRAYRGEHEPSVYRLMWLPHADGSPATNRWKGIGPAQIEAFQMAKKGRAEIARRKREAFRQTRERRKIVRLVPNER